MGNMNEKVKIRQNGLKEIRKIDERFVSYNIEMTEITGGTFWKEYTPEQIAGTEMFTPAKSFFDMEAFMREYPPVDLYEEKIRKFAKALGPVYVRVSGSWATDTYYDFDGHTKGIVPKGYKSILTKKQWQGVLDFVREVGAKLLISVSNCKGDHENGKAWSSEQAKLLFDFSRDYGVPISAAEFMNEPNVLVMDPPTEGYGAVQFGRDQDTFFRFVRENYPEVKLVGPCACADVFEKRQMENRKITSIPTKELLSHCSEEADVFSYHCYTGFSERGATLGKHWDAEEALSEAYLSVSAKTAQNYTKIRDRFFPRAQMWVTESADAGLGGNTWGSTFLDVFRYVDELGRFAMITDGIIFHNTLASSDYGLLDHRTHLPRPNYWMVYLWNRLVGTTVYDSGEKIREGAHIYAHSRKDGEDGYTYICMNNSKINSLELELPKSAELYLLGAKKLRAREIQINGVTPFITEKGDIREIFPDKIEKGIWKLPPKSIAFLVV